MGKWINSLPLSQGWFLKTGFWREVMKRKIILLAVSILALTNIVANLQARPSYATSRNNNCFACHSAPITGALDVVEHDFLIDLGTLGELKTFQAIPGKTLTIPVEILNVPSRFAVQIKDFEKPALLNNPANLLFWSEANDQTNIWTHQEVNNPIYFTKDNGSNGGISNSVAPVKYEFDLFIDATTPLDIYKLVMTTAGPSSAQGRWYQEEHFYIEVICPYYLAGDVNNDCKVNLLDLADIAANWLADCTVDKSNPACILK